MNTGARTEVAVAVQGLHQRAFHGQAEALEVGAVLDLGVQADGALLADLQAFHQVDDLLQGGDLEGAVQARIARADRGDALDGAQGLQFGEGEVFAEPAGEFHSVDFLRALAVGEFRVLGDIGGQAQLVVVAGDQLAVAGHHQVRLDVVGAHHHRQGVGAQGVFRYVTAGATVGDDQRRAFVAGWVANGGLALGPVDGALYVAGVGVGGAGQASGEHQAGGAEVAAQEGWLHDGSSSAVRECSSPAE